MTRMRITITDQSGSVETVATHGLADLAAALAEDAWETTPIARNAGRLFDAIDAIVANDAPKIADPLTTLLCVRDEAIRYGARLGFALSRTVSAAEQGWPAWLQAANDWLTQGGCQLEEHQKAYSESAAKEAVALAEAPTKE